jgi:hypothetical protein
VELPRGGTELFESGDEMSIVKAFMEHKKVRAIGCDGPNEWIQLVGEDYIQNQHGQTMENPLCILQDMVLRPETWELVEEFNKPVLVKNQYGEIEAVICPNCELEVAPFNSCSACGLNFESTRGVK